MKNEKWKVNNENRYPERNQNPGWQPCAIITGPVQAIGRWITGSPDYCTTSESRCFSDPDYVKEGIELSDDLKSCDVLLGVKEVKLQNLIPDKTYFFFSHTIKKQPHNKALLQAILERNIRLVDYEVLTDRKWNTYHWFWKMGGTCRKL